MKYLVPCFLLVPFLTSCNVIQAGYYEPPGYYHSAPHSRVEARPFVEHRHIPHHRGYKPRPDRGHVHPGHGPHHGHVHPHHMNQHGHAVVVNPRHPQAHVEVQKKIHGHEDQVSTGH